MLASFLQFCRNFMISDMSGHGLGVSKPVRSPRRHAIAALGTVFKGPGKPKDVLEGVCQGMSQRDRAFVMELAYGVLRFRDTIDMILSWLMDKPSGVPARTRDNLRMAIYQIFFMRVPDWAAVNEAVELEGRFKGLVNGVLRSASRRQAEFVSRLDAMKSEVAGADKKRASELIASLTSHPLWLVTRWVARLGAEDALALALANNEIPHLVLRVNTLRATREDVLNTLQQKGIACEPTRYSPDGIRLEGTVPFASLALEGLVSVQDESAQLVSLMMGARPGQRVLDACAAPGGKAMHLAGIMQDRGEVVALDIDARRIERLEANIRAMGLHSVRPHVADIREFSDPAGFDHVLLDSPCSAMGVIRRNPDIKYRRKCGDLKKFATTQSELIRAASAMVRPGGRLLYAVCSTEPEEGEAVIDLFLKSSADFDIIYNDLNISPAIIDCGYMRTWPHRNGMDGFFAVVLGRKE